MNDYYEKDFNVYEYELTLGIIKRDSDGAFAELDEYGYYKYLYYDKPENIYSFLAKYSDYLKKQYSYNKNLYLAYRNDPKVRECTASDEEFFYFFDDEGYIYDILTYEDNNGVTQQCQKLYLLPYDNDELKNISEKFITTLIFSIIICLCYAGSIVFGIILYYTPIF